METIGVRELRQNAGERRPARTVDRRRERATPRTAYRRALRPDAGATGSGIQSLRGTRPPARGTIVIYLDSSALAKLIVKEVESTALRAWLDERLSTPRYSSALARTELPRAVRTGGDT